MIAALLLSAFAQAAQGTPADGIEIEQRLDEQVPLELEFVDSDGTTVTLDDLVDERPVVLSLVYYECPVVCPVVLEQLNGCIELCGSFASPHRANCGIWRRRNNRPTLPCDGVH